LQGIVRIGKQAATDGIKSADRSRHGFYGLRKKCNKGGKSFLLGPFVPQDKLKPVESTHVGPFEARMN
jgi:hypothetical protein